MKKSTKKLLSCLSALQLLADFADSTGGCLDMAIQGHIMEQVFRSKEAAEYPPPLEYRRRFLKELARKAKDSQEEGVDEGVMDALGKLLVLPTSQVFITPS